MSTARAPAAVRALVACGLGAASTLTAATSPGDTKPDEAAAQALFDQAKGLMARGQFAQACPRLEESQRLDPGVGTLLNLADCYEKIDRLGSAWSTFLDAASAAREAGQSERELAAQQRAAALGPRLPKIVVSVPREARVPGLVVRRDGQALGEAQFNLPVPTDPGVHVVEASAPDRRPWRDQFAVRAEATLTTATVPILVQDVATQREAAASSSLGVPRTLALVAAGVGVAGLAVGTGFAIHARSDDDQANAKCPMAACPDMAAVAQSRDAVRESQIATGAFVVAGAFVATGAVLWLTAKPPGRASRGGAAVEVGLAPGALRLRGAW